MTAHTPGPWRVQGADNAIVGQRNGLPECIGQVFNVMEGRQYPGAWSPVSGANARLIAAAPRMLALLKRTYGRCQDETCKSENCAIGRAILRDVEGQS